MEFAIFLVYTNEVFPTQIRGTALGFSSALGTIASTSSPYIFGTEVSNNTQTSLLMLVFLGVCLLCFWLFVKILPETLGQPIQDEIAEEEG